MKLDFVWRREISPSSNLVFGEEAFREMENAFPFFSFFSVSLSRRRRDPGLLHALGFGVRKEWWGYRPIYPSGALESGVFLERKTLRRCDRRCDKGAEFLLNKLTGETKKGRTSP